jgi:ATP-binding cassette subfamily C protein
MIPTSLATRINQLKPLLVDLFWLSPTSALYVLGLMVVSSLSSGIGILLIIPLLSSVDVSLGADSSGTGIQPYFDMAFNTLGLEPSLGLILSIYLLLIICVALINYLNAVAGAKLERNFVVSLRRRVFQSLLNANWQYLSSKRMSDFARLVTGQVQSIGLTVFQIITLASKLVLITVYLALSLWLSPSMTLLALLCSAALVTLMLPLNNLTVCASAE